MQKAKPKASNRSVEAAPVPQKSTIDILGPEVVTAAILEQASDAGTRFGAGDVVMFYDPDHEWHGTEWEITKGFGLHKIDKRTQSPGEPPYKMGYVAKTLGEGPYFLPAGKVRDRSGNLRHIREVPRYTRRRRAVRAKGGAA